MPKNNDETKNVELKRWNFIYQLYQEIFELRMEKEFARQWMEERLPDDGKSQGRFSRYMKCKWEEWRQENLDSMVKPQQNARRLKDKVFQKQVREFAKEERKRLTNQVVEGD